MTFTWQGGHQLVQTVKSGVTTAYVYNEAGRRTQKTVGTDTYHYYYRGSKLIADVGPNDTLYFRYNSAGQPAGFTCRVGTTDTHYTYVKNQQGDILAVLGGSGAVIGSYVYDAWGKLLSVCGTDTAIANRGPNMFIYCLIPVLAGAIA